MKKLITGFIAGVMMSSLIGFAYTTLQVYDKTGEHKLIINNQEIDMQEYKILNYNSRSYVPLRLVSEQLNKVVGFESGDNGTGTIHIGDIDYKVVSKVRTQKPNGCTLYAMISAFEIEYFRKTGKIKSINANEFYDNAPQYGYNFHNGAWLDYAYAYLAHRLIELDYNPYNTSESIKIKSNPSVTEIKALIDSGKIVVVAVDAFDGLSEPENGYVDYNPNPNTTSGHAICIVDYNEDGFIIKNSYGTEYGNQGYATMDYDYKILQMCTFEINN